MRTWETPRLTLRRVLDADYEHFCSLYADPGRMRYIGHGAPRDRSETRGFLDAMLRHWTLYGFGRWVMLSKPGGEWVGRCGLSWMPGADHVELGYILRAEFEGRGLATEASRAALAYGFDELRLPRIVAVALPENAASRRIMEKVGMRYERNGPAWGAEAVWYAIDRDAWAARGKS